MTLGKQNLLIISLLSVLALDCKVVSPDFERHGLALAPTGGGFQEAAILYGTKAKSGCYLYAHTAVAVPAMVEKLNITPFQSSANFNSTYFNYISSSGSETGVNISANASQITLQKVGSASAKIDGSASRSASLYIGPSEGQSALIDNSIVIGGPVYNRIIETWKEDEKFRRALVQACPRSHRIYLVVRALSGCCFVQTDTKININGQLYTGFKQAKVDVSAGGDVNISTTTGGCGVFAVGLIELNSDGTITPI